MCRTPDIFQAGHSAHCRVAMAQRLHVVVLGLGELHPAHDRSEDALALKLPVQQIALLNEQKRVGA